MLESDVIKLITDALIVTLKVSGPVLAVTLVVGLLISILQTTTSIQEQTLTFVPKLAAVFLSIVFFSAWMIHTVVDYTRTVFQMIAKY